mgnify:FL=1|tara:strand:- start:164 stop:1396 length:1233 start_codon:yes stop_codon:yes gene_type:complete
MNILTDVLSLWRRGVYAKKAELNDVLVLGVSEEPDMTGVASPIPYKSVKLIKVKDLKVAAEGCDQANSPATPAAGTGQVYQKTDVDAKTETCTVYFRSLKSMSSNLTLATSADDDYIEITTEGEPNTAANVGTGAGLWKNKVGETLNFKSLKPGSNISFTEASNEITISAASSGGMSKWIASAETGTNINILDNNVARVMGSSGLSTSIANNGNGADIDVKLDDTGVIAGTYTSADIIVNSRGQITTASNGSGGGGGMTDFLINGDSGSPQTVSNGDTAVIEGGEGINTAGTGGPKVVVNMNHFYTAYVCKLSQTGTNDPTESIVYNDTGLTLTWSRVGTGQFTATWSTPQDGTKVTVNPMCTFKNTPNLINVTAFSNASFTLSTWNLSGTSVEVDDTLLNSPVEIRIYP